MLLGTSEDTLHGWDSGLSGNLYVGSHALNQGIGYIDLPCCFHRCVRSMDFRENFSDIVQKTIVGVNLAAVDIWEVSQWNILK